MSTSRFLLFLSLIACTGLFTADEQAKEAEKVEDRDEVTLRADPWQGWMASDLDYCDAAVLGRAWGVEIDEAKTKVGRFVQAGENAALASALTTARKQADQATTPVCDWSWAPFGYDDAETLAAVWGVSVDDAKTKIARHVSGGRSALVTEALGQPLTNIDNFRSQDPMHRYGESDYGYCDAQLIAKTWGIDAYAAKAAIGDKLIAVGPELVESSLAHARQTLIEEQRAPACSFHETGFQYADAAVVSDAWGMDIDETKTKMAMEVFAGREKDLRTLIAARLSAGE